MSAAELRQAAATLRDGGVNRCNADVVPALADLLDEIALRWDWVEERELALVVARAVNGGES